MYKKLKKIANVRTRIASGNHIHFVQNDKSLCFTGTNEVLNFEKSIYKLLEFNKEILLFDINNRLIRQPNTKFNFEEQVLKVQSNSILFYVKTKPRRTYGIFDGQNIIYSSNQIGGNFNFLDKKVIDFNSNAIFATNLNEDLIWSLPIHSLGKTNYEHTIDEIDKIIGIAHGNLWLTTKGGRLIVLDSSTGKIIKKFSNQTEDIDLDYEITLIGTSLYLKHNYIYGMSGNNFQKINTKSYEIEESFDFRKEDPEGMGKFEYVYSPIIQGEYFTFLGEKRHTDGVRFIGLFDFKKRKLIWEYELISIEEFRNGNRLIIPEHAFLDGNKLHVKDFQNTLHILELN